MVEIMKRFALFVIYISLTALPSAVWSASASEREAMRNKIEEHRQQLDSLSTLLQTERNRYKAEPSERERIASRIVALEQEERKLSQAYNQILTQFAIIESRDKASSSLNDTPTADGNNNKPTAASTTDKVRADLTRNAPFVELLSAADYKTLRETERRERSVAKRIGEYAANYDTMVALQLEHQRTDSEKAADSLTLLVESKRQIGRAIEQQITNEWQQVFDNKIYIYNLLLEKGGHSDILGLGEGIIASAAIEAEKESSAVESEAIALYFHQKRGLLNYESQIAKHLNLAPAKDSLQRAIASMQRSAYHLPKVVIERRSFIDHEPLKIIKPTIYTSKNPIPKTRLYEYGTVYRIRIGIFTNRPNLSALRGITPLSYSTDYHNGKYAYFVGGFRTEEEANDGVKYLKRIGFRDPLVVMWVNGEYVSNIEEWKKNNATGYVIEITGTATLSDAIKTHISLRNDQCNISRIGATFIISPFADKAEADKIASEISAMEPKIKANVSNIKPN